MTMTVNNKAVKECSGLPLLTELPSGLIFSEICSQDYSGKDREFTSCVAPLSRVGSLALTGLVPQGAPQFLSRPSPVLLKRVGVYLCFSHISPLIQRPAR
jgi:hypothetical protein